MVAVLWGVSAFKVRITPYKTATLHFLTQVPTWIPNFPIWALWWPWIFLIVNCVYAFQSPRVSSLFKDTDCLFHNGKLCLCISVTQSVHYSWTQTVTQRVSQSPLFRDLDCLLCNKKLCLCISVTPSVSIIQWFGLSTLLCRFEIEFCLRISFTWSVSMIQGLRVATI